MYVYLPKDTFIWWCHRHVRSLNLFLSPQALSGESSRNWWENETYHWRWVCERVASELQWYYSDAGLWIHYILYMCAFQTDCGVKCTGRWGIEVRQVTWVACVLEWKRRWDTYKCKWLRKHQHLLLKLHNLHTSKELASFPGSPPLHNAYDLWPQKNWKIRFFDSSAVKGHTRCARWERG